MRVASFNVENLFDRAKALALPTWAEGRVVLEQHERLNKLLNRKNYTPTVKAKIVELLNELGLEERDDGGEFVLLRQNRGRLLKRPESGGIEIVAKGRSDWIGWAELKTEPVNELATQHTAMVMRDLDPDVLAVIEADNRVVLKKFSAIVLEAVDAMPFEHVMVIDGNDDRGIDVGVMTRAAYEIVGVRSHVDDTDSVGEIFSRDCPEYVITPPVLAAQRLTVLNGSTRAGASAGQAKRRRPTPTTCDQRQVGFAPSADRCALWADAHDTGRLNHYRAC